MGSTLVREIKVFKMQLGIDTTSLFGSETVAIATETCSKNTWPHNFRWGFEFIGSTDMLMEKYIPMMTHFYDDGIVQKLRVNGKGFQKLIGQLFKEARPLTLNDLRELGFFGYSWPVEEIHKIHDRSHLKTFTCWLGTRCGAGIDTEDDARRMIQEAYAMVPPSSDDIWMARLWRHSVEQVNMLAGAEEGATLRAF